MHGIIGLGNPGPQYAETRHNVGFHIIDVLAERHRLPEPQRLLAAIVGRGRIKEAEVLVVKPMTFMNDSGPAVARICVYFDLAPSDLLLIYDDINIDLGTLRLRREGSAGGHRGVQSIIDFLDTEEIPRLRLGLGMPPPEMTARDFVLSPFDPEEEEAAEQMIVRAAQAVECFLAEGIEAAMNGFNE